MNQEEVEKVENRIKEVLAEGESYDFEQIESALALRRTRALWVQNETHHLLEVGGSLRAILWAMLRANVLGEEQVTKYFLTEDKQNVK